MTFDWCSQYCYSLHMGNLLEPQQMNDTRGTIAYTEMVDRGLMWLLCYWKEFHSKITGLHYLQYVNVISECYICTW